MFDIKIVKTAAPYPQHVHVTEKRAPTDESVRLLDEFQRRAEDRVVAAWRLSNTLADSIVAWTQDHFTGHSEISVMFSLNGERKLIKIPLADGVIYTNADVFCAAGDAMAREIASLLMTELMIRRVR